MTTDPRYGDDPVSRPARRDTVRHDIQAHVWLSVYWKILPNGKGPAVSLFVRGDEVLKFDCFGKDKGHYHIALMRPKGRCRERLFFPEQTVEEQITRTGFELKVNLPYYLDRHPDKGVRKVEIDTARLAKAVDAACRKMFEFQRTVPELRTTDE